MRTCLVILVALLACGPDVFRVTDDFNNVVIDQVGHGEATVVYALGAQVELRMDSSDATLTSSNAEVLRLDTAGFQAFTAYALREGDTDLEFRAGGERDTRTVQVLRAESIVVPNARAVRGGQLRLALRGTSPATVVELGIRNQTTTSTEGAVAWTPVEGPDEIWVDVPDEPDCSFEVSLSTPSGEDVFPVSFPTDEPSAVARVEIEPVPAGPYQARAYAADGTLLLGAQFVWTLDGVNIPTEGTPSDQIGRSAWEPEPRQLCAESNSVRTCVETTNLNFAAI